MVEDTFDVVVIGAGPGGYVAALHTARRGMKVACVEAADFPGGLGGVCNNAGCIPTKALLESASYAAKLGGLGPLGVTVKGVELDFAQAVRHSREAAEAGVKGITYLFRKNGVASIRGWGRLAGAQDDGRHAVAVTGGDGERTLTARHVVVATGSRPRDLPFLRFDGERVWSSDQAVTAEAVPASLAVVGAGAVGMEFADVYASFGARVTVIEALDRVLPNEDAEAAAVVERAFRKRGIEVLTGTRLSGATVGSGGVVLQATATDGAARTVEAERVLVAIGRAPLVDDVGLDAVSVATERGAIVTDARMRTNVPGVYAIGDVTRPPYLAHKAWAEAAAVAATIAGEDDPGVDYGNIPSVTYCHPEVASVGLTEAAAKAAGLAYTAGTFPWSANGRARGMVGVEGFVKVLRDSRHGEILGAHIVGPHASELIGTFVVGRLLETTAEFLERAVLPHPTLSDSLPEAALAALGQAVHL
jgi:dihydrolipoamide dehydrogenase